MSKPNEKKIVATLMERHGDTFSARSLAKNGWTTARKMGEGAWEERTRVLNHAGYARYGEKTSRLLTDTSELLLERYGEDLRKLRLLANAEKLAELVPKKDCPRLLAAFIRCRLAKDHKEVLDAARED
jgi:hypothetical protein